MSFYSLSMFVYIDFASYKNAEINIVYRFCRLSISIGIILRSKTVGAHLAHILKSEGYGEDSHGCCTKMTHSWTVPFFHKK